MPATAMSKQQIRHHDTVMALQRAAHELRAALEEQTLPGGEELEAAGRIKDTLADVKDVAEMCQRYSEVPY